MPFLRLWHGRRSLDADLDGWGEDGPTFGPFPFFHMTYCSEIKFHGSKRHMAGTDGRLSAA
jgi:hypothetical protein